MAWGEREVLAASDAWRWIPPEATTYEIDGVQVIDYPAWAFTSFFVTPLDTGRTEAQAPALIDRIASVARTQGESSTTWWISPSTRPEGFGESIEAVGGELTATLDIFAYDLTDGLPDVGPIGGIDTRFVEDEQTLDDFFLVSDAVWGAPADRDGRRTVALADIGRPLAEQEAGRVVAYADGEPIGMGGMQVVDGVARLWGAATVESARGRGAYRAVLHRRIASAREQGATLALVHAKVGTSGPVVARCGFTSYGRAYDYRLPLD